ATLEKVIGFVYEMRPDLGNQKVAAEPEAVSETAVDTPPSTPDAGSFDAVTAKVLEIVAKQTGYPPDMLELDLDLEADLGIDTVKQAETFAAIRSEFDIPRRDDLALRDYTTLEKVIGFVYEMRPDLKVDGVMGEVAGVVPAPTRITPSSLENANRVPRRMPVAVLRPALAWCKPTGVTLGADSRVLVALDQGGVGKAVISRLEKRGATVLALDVARPTAELVTQVTAWRHAGAIQGVYWLAALDAEPDLMELDLAAWRELNRQRSKNLYATMRALYDVVNQPGTFLVTATRLGGQHGYGAAGAAAPLGGAVVGFAKAYKRERPDVLVKAVDFELSRKTAVFADALLAETETDPGAVEVGYVGEQRVAIGLQERPLPDTPALTLDEHTVFVVTGAAGGITSAIVADLAAASGGIFYLLDLVAVPTRHDAQVQLFRSDKEALKQQLIAAAKAAGERPTPALIEKQLLAIERTEAALRAIEAVEAAGGTAHYHSVNLLDGEAVTAVIADIRTRYGKIDALVHAGGLEISRSLDKKEAREFDLVFDVKADGFFNLLRAAHDLPIAATVVFSSVAGRFGNNGQTDYSAANDLLCKVTSSLR
ncbi:MAG: SDR family NAD(P)-dependent oxidoreductase, partial [Anaerolineales bacterium]|nr:SDR family NAD(P)-dependent oxidoreductase [Anaerolineales bacterium]